MKIPGNVTTFKVGDLGGNSRDFDITSFEVTSTYDEGDVEIAFHYKGLRYYLEFNFGKMMTAALKRAENGQGRR